MTRKTIGDPWKQVAFHECQAETPPAVASRHRILAEAVAAEFVQGDAIAIGERAEEQIRSSQPHRLLGHLE